MGLFYWTIAADNLRGLIIFCVKEKKRQKYLKIQANNLSYKRLLFYYYFNAHVLPLPSQ
uniref:Uncharacterized protein n=1 Tax=Physcomitrium patens TaxID=3218 RepID=A0A2K1L6Q2_PHYPA|nr:hypothetical protein PHYPA_000131 [Physcomitrium patens]